MTGAPCTGPGGWHKYIETRDVDRWIHAGLQSDVMTISSVLGRRLQCPSKLAIPAHFRPASTPQGFRMTMAFPQHYVFNIETHMAISDPDVPII